MRVIACARINQSSWRYISKDAKVGACKRLRMVRKQHTCTDAVCGGSLELLQYVCTDSCRWSVDTAASAIRNGRLDMLKWMFVEGQSWYDAPEHVVDVLTHTQFAERL